MGHKIITIGRQFGSGGHEIGDRLSKSLGIPLYDRNLVEMAADKMGPVSYTHLAITVISSALYSLRSFSAVSSTEGDKSTIINFAPYFA